MVATALLALLIAAPPADEAPGSKAPGYIGIQAQAVTAELRKAHKIAKDVEAGIVLTMVMPKTAAARAGLRVGDVLTSFDNKPVRSVEELLTLLKDKKAGQKVAYVARRGSGTIAGLLVLGKRPAVRPSQGRVDDPEPPVPAPGREEDMERRVKALQAEMEALHVRAKQKAAAAERARQKAAGAERARRQKAAPKRLTDWIQREEQGLVAAEKQKNVQKIIWHKARLNLLREMRKTGGMRRNQQKSGDPRVAKLERRLNQVLKRLEKQAAALNRE